MVSPFYSFQNLGGIRLRITNCVYVGVLISMSVCLCACVKILWKISNILFISVVIIGEFILTISNKIEVYNSNFKNELLKEPIKQMLI